MDADARPEPRPPILVIGIGNPLLGDDGVGWRVTEAVARRLAGTGPAPTPDSPWGPIGTTIEVDGTGPVEFDCLSLGGLSLMERLVGYDRAVLIDSVVTGAAPAGTVATHPLEAFADFSAGHTTSAHDTSLMTALDTGRRMGAHLPRAIDVVTIEALQVLDFSEEMTPDVEAAVPRAVDAVLALLGPRGAGAFVVAGDVFVDVVVQLAGPIAPQSDTPARTRLLGGGSAANVAAWLAACGAHVSLVGRVGDDVLGRSQAAELVALGVDARLVTDPQLPTGTCVVLVEADGRRTMFPDPGASEIRPGDLPGELFRPGAHLHLPGYALLREGSRDGGLRAIELARAAGMSVSVDASSSAPLAAVGSERFLDWIGGVDVLFANQAEAAVLSGEQDPVVAARRLAAVARGVVVKLGEAGAVWVDGDGATEHVAAEPSIVVDSTGAGDAFAAGFLAAWRGGAEPVEALRSGAQLAARAVARPGARPTPGTGAAAGRAAAGRAAAGRAAAGGDAVDVS